MLVIDNGDAIRGIAEVASKLDFTVNGYVGTTATQLADGQLASIEGDLYASSADATIVTSITVVNTDSVARTFTIYLKPSGGTSRAITPVSLDLPASYSFYTDGQRMIVMSTGGEVVQTYSLHATSHTDGTDDIQDATAAQKGLATAAQITKLDGIEATADVTDATNVDAAGAVMEGDTAGGDLGGTYPNPTVDAASEASAGKVELATAAETTTGTDNTRAVSPDGLAGSNPGIRYLQMVPYDFTIDVATGDGKFYTHIPTALNGMNLIYCHAEVITAGTTNTTNIQIHNATDTADMLSTVLTIDSGETGSDTAATPYVINGATDDVATNDVLRIDIDAVSTTAPKGLIVTLGFQLP